jgi:hypothetical protein
MDDDYARIFGKPKTNDDRQAQGNNLASSSSTPLFPGTFPSEVNVMHPFRNSALSVPPDFHSTAGSTARAALLAGTGEAESQRDLQLQPQSAGFPAAQSITERVQPTLEQQLELLIKEQQRRALPLTVEQQLASFIEEQQGRSTSFQNSTSSSIPLARALTTDHVQASLTDQQQQRGSSHQPYPALNNALDGIPTSAIEQLLASLNDGRGSFQAASSAQNSAPCMDEQLAPLLNEQQQRRTSDFQERRMPSIEQLLASLNNEHQRRHGSFQATSSLPNSSSILQDQLGQGYRGSSQDMIATLDQQGYRVSSQDRIPMINQQGYRSSAQDGIATLDQHSYRGLSQDRISTVDQQGYHGSFQDRIPTVNHHGSSQDMQPTIEQQLASLIQAAGFTRPSNGPTEHQLPLPLSPEHLHRLEQLQRDFAPLQRDFAPQAQPEIQTQAAGCNVATTNEGHRVTPLPVGVPREFPVSMPAPYGSQETFPGKLYCLLVEAEREGNDHIISFTPDGGAFKINNREAFIEVESPKHFRHTHITSFVRQLNFYGFKRQPKGPNRGGFAHPFFLRGHPELLVKIEKKEFKQRAKKGR